MTHSAQCKGATANQAKAINGIEAKKALGNARSLRDRKQTFAQIAEALISSGFRNAKGRSTSRFRCSGYLIDHYLLPTND